MTSLSYKDAGVDTHEGMRAVEMMKKHVASTYTEGVASELGGFGGMFKLGKSWNNPVLVSGTDGVGTKLNLAFMMDQHDTVGQDLVAMCVNDILCQGATPLFFLDYMATGALKAEKAADIVGGIANGCRQASCALLGGETAEMPGFYQPGEYDLAGFAVGVVDEEKVVTGENIDEGDVVIGLSSSGFHSNGYSLVRKVFFEHANMSVDSCLEGYDKPLGDILIEPTRIYVKSIMSLLDSVDVNGMVHITGGGFYENIPRILPENCHMMVDQSAWDVPPIFRTLQSLGNIENDEMFKTFNMGIGFIIIVKNELAKEALNILNAQGEDARVIGRITRGERGITL